MKLGAEYSVSNPFCLKETFVKVWREESQKRVMMGNLKTPTLDSIKQSLEEKTLEHLVVLATIEHGVTISNALGIPKKLAKNSTVNLQTKNPKIKERIEASKQLWKRLIQQTNTKPTSSHSSLLQKK